jgi:hypothetical protein
MIFFLQSKNIYIYKIAKRYSIELFENVFFLGTVTEFFYCKITKTISWSTQSAYLKSSFSIH